MRKNIVTLVLCLIFPLCIMLMAPVTAVTRAVGVSTGDWAKFSVSSNSRGAIDDTWIKNFLLSDWTNVSVVDVSGTNVTLHFTSHFEINGTFWYSDDYVDLTSGESNHAILALISAGLKTGDPIYENNSVVINETVPEFTAPVLIISFLAVSLAMVSYKIHKCKTNEAERTGKNIEYWGNTTDEARS